MKWRDLNIFYLDDISGQFSNFSLNIKKLGGKTPICSETLSDDKVSKILKKGIDIAFMDYDLSTEDLTGLNEAQKLSEMHIKAGHKIPIFFVLLTAFGSEKVAQETIITGLFRDYINKPIDCDKLNKVFRNFQKFRENQLQRQKEILSFSVDELELPRLRMGYFKRFYEMMRVSPIKDYTEQNIANKVAEYMREDGKIKPIPKTYNAHLGYFRLHHPEGGYYKNALKIKQIIEEDGWEQWKDLNTFLSEIKKEFTL